MRSRSLLVASVVAVHPPNPPPTDINVVVDMIAVLADKIMHHPPAYTTLHPLLLLPCRVNAVISLFILTPIV